MPVIAEKAETEEQFDALKADGSTQVQRYLISRPAPIAQFERVVIEPRAALLGMLKAAARGVSQVRKRR